MDDIRSKILSLWSKQPAKIPSMGFSDATYHLPAADALCVNSKTAPEGDRPADQEILESIAAAYFSPDGLDISRFELEKLPEHLDCERIQADFTRLKRQHQAVSQKVLQLIVEQQSACGEQFADVLHLVGALGDTVRACRDGRVQLRAAERQTAATLAVLAGHRRRGRAQRLLADVRAVRALHRSEHALRVLLAHDDFAAAIELIGEWQRAARAHAHLACVAALQTRLQEALDAVDAQLDAALAAVCARFDGVRYARLHAAYALLGKAHLAVDALHVHYVGAICSEAVRVVRAHSGADAQQPYRILCERVQPERFIACLLELCGALFAVLRSYRHLVRWHEAHAATATLADSAPKLWADAQSKVCGLLTHADLSAHQVEQFMRVLDVVHRLIAVGDDFCGGACRAAELRDAVRAQSAIYFRHYHAQRLDELRIFVEHEAWRVCPVRATFDVLQLREFRALRRTLRHLPAAVDSASSSSSAHSQDGDCFVRFAERGTPFDAAMDSGADEEDILLSDDDDDHEEEQVDSDDEEPARRHLPPTSIIIANTTLSVLRQMGNYVQMSRLLQPIAGDIVRSMCELFDFYLHAAHAFFAADLTVAAGNLYSLPLSATLRRIRESLAGDDAVSGLLAPTLSRHVDLTQPETLFGLAERIVGVESLVFLAAQHEMLLVYVESLLPASFFAQTISSARDLRRPVYMSVCAQAFDLRQILAAMAKINWEVKEVMSQQNAYVDAILGEVRAFATRLEAVGRQVHVGVEVAAALWESVAHIITHTLVQGFAEAKRCTPCGRALMRLDFAHFAHQFELVARLRPVPHRDYVDNYINAFYVPDAELDEWMRAHPEYSSKHLHGLVSCVCQSNKKSKQRLLQVIEDLERTHR